MGRGGGGGGGGGRRGRLRGEGLVYIITCISENSWIVDRGGSCRKGGGGWRGGGGGGGVYKVM